MSEWENIEGFADWRQKLASLLKEAEAVAQKPELAPRLAMNSRLTDFIVHSRPNNQEISELDKIAEGARQALMHMTIEERLREISARTGELTLLTKQIEAGSSANAAATAKLRLGRAHRVVDAMTDSIRALAEFKAGLAGGSDAELAESIEQLMALVQKFRNEIERQV